MKITDEQLSAFLDAELPELEMEVIREQLIEDENLANRLAELAMVDELVSMSAATIDARPVPESMSKLLAQDEPKTATIIAFPLLRKLQRSVQQHSAIAASVALVFGFGIAQLFQADAGNSDWQAVAKILETAPSGIEQLAANGAQVKPRLTFTNKNGDFCRQFVMTHNRSTSENIACRSNNQWQLSATVYVDKVQQADTYQTASGGSLLDSTVEQMAHGDFFDAQAEAAAIQQHWPALK